MPNEPNEKLTKEEVAKAQSNYLRGTIKEELKENSSHFNETNIKLLKFHGVYQQDDRDTRQERIANKLEKEYSFMIRTKLPSGQLTGKQYLQLNEVCNEYANKTLRITTRQTIQFHGIIKGDLHESLNEINKNLITTYGACGDVVRNVTACPVCDIDLDYSIDLTKIAKEISDHLLPNTRSYYEVWVDEEKIDLGNNDEEPLYGKTYLPRKFKIGISLPHDNCIDVFTQDVGIIATEGGFNLLIGGGLGHTHNKPETYPRLASELCFTTQEKLLSILENIVKIQKDYGIRTNRKHARLKYLIDDKGVDWFKNELEKRLGYKLESFKKLNDFKTTDHLGWHKQKNGLWYIGLFIENGRILDDSKKQIKTGLKEIIEEFNPDIRLTAHQNIVLVNIKEEDKNKINEKLETYKIFKEETVSSLRRNSMACPALPTCGLALAEAERYLPNVIDELESLGFKDEVLTLRISGCPNSCSRTPVSELGIIGTSTNKYNVYVGGDFQGTRLNKIYKENVSSQDLVGEIAKLFNAYRENKKTDEGFGNFCTRVSIEKLRLLINH